MDQGETIETLKLASQLSQARNELNNIRKTLHSVRAQHKGDVERLEDLLESAKSLQIHSFKNKEKPAAEKSPSKIKNYENVSEKLAEAALYHMKPIGIAKSLHRQKNGTPRQGVVSSLSRAKLQIEKDIYNNPSHSLDGLEEYSHVWLIYIFHQNTSDGSHAKVSPPRLDGSKLGVFSTRSPHRPNPIGLTLAKLDKVEGDALLLSGVDIIDGTPVIDVKPYIPYYDSPVAASNKTSVEFMEPHLESGNNPAEIISMTDIKDVVSQKEEIDNEIQNEKMDLFERSEVSSKSVGNISLSDDTEAITSANKETVEDISFDENNLLHLDCEDSLNSNSEIVSVPHWIKSPPSAGLRVIFNPIAEQQIKCFSCDAQDPSFRLEYLKSDQELWSAIASVLSEDPRSTYRRQKCPDRLYFFMVDSAHITTCFFGDIVEVLRVSPLDKESPCFKLI